MPVRRDDDRNHRHLLTCHFFQLLLVVFLSFKRSLGVSNVKKGLGVSTIYGEMSIPNAIFQHSDGRHFRRTAGGYDVFFRSPPIQRSAFISGNDWAAHRVLQSEKTHHQTLLHLLLLQIKCPKKMHVFTLALVFLALFVLPYVVCLCVFFYNFFPKGNELQLPCWVAPPWQEHLGMDLNKLPEVVPIAWKESKISECLDGHLVFVDAFWLFPTKKKLVAFYGVRTLEVIGMFGCSWKKRPDIFHHYTRWWIGILVSLAYYNPCWVFDAFLLFPTKTGRSPGSYNFGNYLRRFLL